MEFAYNINNYTSYTNLIQIQNRYHKTVVLQGVSRILICQTPKHARSGVKKGWQPRVKVKTISSVLKNILTQSVFLICFPVIQQSLQGYRTLVPRNPENQ